MSKNVIIGILAILLTVVVSVTCTVYFVNQEEEKPDFPTGGTINIPADSFPTIGE